jgi:hypothetical protein
MTALHISRNALASRVNNWGASNRRRRLLKPSQSPVCENLLLDQRRAMPTSTALVVFGSSDQ